MRWVFALSLVLGMLALIGRVMLEGARGRGSDQRRSIMARPRARLPKALDVIQHKLRGGCLIPATSH